MRLIDLPPFGAEETDKHILGLFLRLACADAIFRVARRPTFLGATWRRETRQQSLCVWYYLIWVRQLDLAQLNSAVALATDLMSILGTVPALVSNQLLAMALEQVS
jgi:hypothetical protein